MQRLLDLFGIIIENVKHTKLFFETHLNVYPSGSVKYPDSN